jgi:hypothetical protein
MLAKMTSREISGEAEASLLRMVPVSPVLSKLSLAQIQAEWLALLKFIVDHLLDEARSETRHIIGAEFDLGLFEWLTNTFGDETRDAMWTGDVNSYLPYMTAWVSGDPLRQLTLTFMNRLLDNPQPHQPPQGADLDTTLQIFACVTSFVAGIRFLLESTDIRQTA